VQALADTSWRLNRVAALEANLLTLAAAREPNPLDEAPDQIQDAMAIVAALESQSKALSNLSMHSQRLSRQFERTVAQLRDLQKNPPNQEKYDLDNLLDIMEMYESKGEPTAPPTMASFFHKPNQPRNPDAQPRTASPRSLRPRCRLRLDIELGIVRGVEFLEFLVPLFAGVLRGEAPVLAVIIPVVGI